MVSSRYTRSMVSGVNRLPTIDGPIYDAEDVPNMCGSFMDYTHDHGAPTFSAFVAKLIQDWQTFDPDWAEALKWDTSLVKRARQGYQGFIRQVHAGQLCDELFGHKVVWDKMDDVYAKIDLRITRPDGTIVLVALTTKHGIPRAEAKLREAGYRAGQVVVLGVDHDTRYDHATNMSWFTREDLLPIVNHGGLFE